MGLAQVPVLGRAEPIPQVRERVLVPVAAGAGAVPLVGGRASHCRRAEVAEAYGSLSTTGGKVLGTILVGGSHSAGYSDYYDDSYRYSADTWGPPLLEKDERGNGARGSGLS